MAIHWNVTREERELIRSIAERAVASVKREKLTHVEFEMDITATHRNGCPLKLRELLTTDDFNFAHDVFGIRRYIDRETGQLTSCFVPRFAA